MRRRIVSLACCFFATLVFIQTTPAQTRVEKVLNDRIQFTEEGFWIYNDLEGGVAAARNGGMPMLVTFRCIPCEHCVKLDEELMKQDKELQELLGQFVRVRVVTTNGLDLKQFQFDFDQSFAMIIMNADGTIYSRYGTRSDQTESVNDVSIEGLSAALRKSLELHRSYPSNRELFESKQPKETLFATPNDAALHKGKFPEELVFNDNVVKNCIHCHMVGDAEREFFWAEEKPIPDEILFQYPHPKAIGLILDPSTTGTVKEVVADSIADRAGFKPQDELIELEGQAILSIADVQWVLHHAGDEDEVQASVLRDGKSADMTIELPEGWRRQDRIDWRVTSWPLRRMLTGGMVLKEANAEQRKELGLADQQMALVVEHVGQYGAHAAAKRAGFKEGDIVIAYDGQNDLLRETDLLAYGAQQKKKGDRVEIELQRNGRNMKLTLPIQP